MEDLTVNGGNNIAGNVRTPMAETTTFNASRSFREGGRVSGTGSRRRTAVRPSLDADEFMNLLHGSDPVKVELNRLENEVRDKDRELGEAQAEIKALRLSERLREKAVEELTDELSKVDEKLKLAESLLESKNLEIKKINDEKRASMAAQFAAEATLRRVHSAQKDDDMPPIEAILAPLEAELKLARQEISKLQDDNKALERLTKSKEAALIEVERTVQVALAKASMVDDLQNKNQELMKQIEICQEENKIIDKMHRQKVAEVEKLTQTVHELEEAVLAGGATANAVRDYQRKVQEMNDERKTLDRELARAKVTANRVATVVANEWKDANDKVMPVKQWLDERRFLQGEMQQLRDKLAITERAARSEAQLKEKYQLRLRVLEDTIRSPNPIKRSNSFDGKSIINGPSRRQSLGGADNFTKLPSNGLHKRSPSFQMRSALSAGSSSILKHAKGTSRSFDGGTRSVDRSKPISSGSNSPTFNLTKTPDEKPSEFTGTEVEDTVPGLLYDLLQKEVISLRKSGHEKDQSLKDKDDAIEMLSKKVDTLTKAMEVEAKKMRREVAVMEKEVAAMRVHKEQDNRAKRFGSSRGSTNSSQINPARNMTRGGLTRSTQ
ncbi:putative microtubule-associated protein [Helianthus annuus]|uniref:Microtubule-associated protein n=1 Tax=Helianthus annuus TaxID=4232 RepID=A0A251T154_HELAN|nr:microtubule-associated protein 70-2 isoform X1 [Helianthus annuus]KAF5777468.1 putative microtubule-associated protein [Helianthus annuus]KAJ0492665.1 putative microtubule-associated protein [Helianthus annuus]KAJ0862278.1 putative microtubule-associated protein [Helianthus annuus]